MNISRITSYFRIRRIAAFPLLLFLAGCFPFGGPPREVRANIAIIQDRGNWEKTEKIRAAARKLKVLGHPDAVDPLIEMLKHEDPWVRGDARGALIQITGMTFTDNYAEWRRWWDTNRDVFIEDWQARQEVPEEELDSKGAEKAVVQRIYGEAALKDGLLPQAIARFRTATRAEPANPENFIGLGRAYRMALDYEKAEDAFQTAMDLNDALVEPYLNLGICALEQNNVPRALMYLEKAKTADDKRRAAVAKGTAAGEARAAPPNWQILWYLAMAHWERRDRGREDINKSIEYILEILNILPKKQHTQKMYLQLALAYYSNDQYLKAWRMIQGIEASFPGRTVYPGFRNKVKWILYTKYDYDFSKDGEKPPVRPGKQVDTADFDRILNGDPADIKRFRP